MGYAICTKAQPEVNTQYHCKSPVLFLTFNRLDTTQLVFEAIRAVKPPRLYFASDGPRVEREGEGKAIDEVRDFVLRSINWDCAVKTLLRESNLGCKDAVVGAVDWFFECEEQGIILEDDCLPNSSFFRFCDELLHKYETDDRIMQIAGYNIASGKHLIPESYLFSHFGWQWGWATWRRAWALNDLEMKKWPDFKERFSFNRYPLELGNIKTWDAMYSEKVSTWDYQWAFAMRSNYGLSAVPKYSLIENIGFSGDGTHTNNPLNSTQVIVKELEDEILHPLFVYPDIPYDQKAVKIRKGISRKLSIRLRTLLSKMKTKIQPSISQKYND